MTAGLVLAGAGLPFGLSEKLGGLVSLLTARTREIGLAALVLGVLHLILGGFRLI